MLLYGKKYPPKCPHPQNVKFTDITKKRQKNGDIKTAENKIDMIMSANFVGHEIVPRILKTKQTYTNEYIGI